VIANIKLKNIANFLEFR